MSGPEGSATATAMADGLVIQRCTGCGAGYFPERLMCPRCRGFEFRADRVETATVEEVTTVRHVLGQSEWAPRRLASVRTEDGQPITIGLLDDAAEGARVWLCQEGTAPFGRSKPPA